MKRLLVAFAAILVLGTAASAANLVNWTGKLLPLAPTNPPGWIDVVVNATESNSGWLWTYDVTPTGPVAGGAANQLFVFSLDMDADALANFVAGTAGSSMGWGSDITASSIRWEANRLPTGAVNDIRTGNTARFQFVHKWGPNTMNYGYSQDHGQYAALLPTPVVPEPMSIMLGTLGLGVVGGFRKLRRK